MPNRWTDFVKDWARRNNTTYGCALSKPECKDAYHKKFPKPITKKQPKEKKDIQVSPIYLEMRYPWKTMPYTAYLNTYGELVGKPVYHWGTDEKGKPQLLEVGKFKMTSFFVQGKSVEDVIDGINNRPKILPEGTRLVDVEDGTEYTIQHQNRTEDWTRVGLEYTYKEKRT